MNNVLQLGTDAEFFVQDKQGIIKSAIGKIGGSKAKPMLLPYGNLQEDNVLAEFAIDPVSTKRDWIGNIAYTVRALRAHMRKHNYTLVLRSSHHYDKELLKSFPAMAMELGCEPDFNVYQGQENPSPCPYTTLRTAAAHVHFSYTSPSQQETCKIVKAMDYCLGLWSVLEDDDTARRALYGKAGSCRLKTYGGEYRTLGSFWLRTEQMQEYVYDVTRLCVKAPDELLLRLQTIVGEQELQRIINECDRPAATLFYPMISDIISEIQATTAEETTDAKLSA